MVAVAGGAVVYNPWSAVVVGLIAALSFLLWSKLLIKLHVDDPVETAAGKFTRAQRDSFVYRSARSSYWWRLVGHLRRTDLPSNDWSER